MIDLLRALPNWVWGCAGLFLLASLFCTEMRRRERRLAPPQIARPAVRIIGQAAAHPVTPLPTRSIHIGRVLAALEEECFCDED
jgi:hypothetical protein